MSNKYRPGEIVVHRASGTKGVVLKDGPNNVSVSWDFGKSQVIDRVAIEKCKEDK